MAQGAEHRQTGAQAWHRAQYAVARSKTTREQASGNVKKGDQRALRHGHSCVGKHTRTYSIWVNVKTRCCNPNSPAYKDYGARGIDLHEPWKKFDNFLADMGECPPGLQIDRINNNQGYFPGNVRWTTPKVNSRNRRNNRRHTIDGVSKTIPEWAEHYGVVRAQTAYQRVLDSGWPVFKAVTTPIDPKRIRHAR